MKTIGTVLVFLFSYLYLSESLVPHKLGPFDQLAVYNDTVFFISARPCSFDKEVVLTIMRIKEDPIFLHYNVTKDILEPIRIYTNKSIGFILDLHTHELDNELHATIKEVHLTADGKRAGYINNNFIDVTWEIDRQTCQEFIHADIAKNNPGFRPQKDCTYSKRQGDFSTLCYVEQRGIYITVMNICDVPYSVNVVSILSGGVNDTTVENQTYTAEMDTSVIHLTDGKLLGGNCGLILSDFHGHTSDHEKQHVTLKQVCTNWHEGRNMTLIDDAYFTVYGQLCKNSKCANVNRNVNQRSCEVTMRNATGALVKSVITVKLNVCHDNVITGDVEISIDGFPNSFKTSMTSLKTYDRDPSKLVYFNLTKPGELDRWMYLKSHDQKPMYPHSGFLPLTTGQLSLRVDELPSHKKFHVMLFRHYPDWHDKIPLLHDYFYINRNEICTTSKLTKKPEGSLKAWIIVVIVVCVILTLLAAALFYRWWRKRGQYNRDGGLPYHIELDEDEFSLDNGELSRY